MLIFCLQTKNQDQTKEFSLNLLCPQGKRKKAKILSSSNRFSIQAECDNSDKNTFSKIDAQNSNTDVTLKRPPVYTKNVSNISMFISEHLMSVLNSTDFICKSTHIYYIIIVFTHFLE